MKIRELIEYLINPLRQGPRNRCGEQVAAALSGFALVRLGADPQIGRCDGTARSVSIEGDNLDRWRLWWVRRHLWTVVAGWIRRNK